MGRITAACVLGMVLVITSAAPVSRAGQDSDDTRPRRAYKPAERREQEAASQAARREAPAASEDPDVPAGVSDPEAYKKELQAARDQRDRDLKEAANETDRRAFQKRQEQIFARYAAILSEMRDRYAAHQAETGESLQKPAQRQGKTTRAGAVRPGAPERFSGADRPGKSAPRKNAARRADDDADALADAQKRLDDENARHDAAMEDLNQQLADAKASNNKRETRKAERAIDKENTAYEAKKSLLERRVKELGGTIEKPKAPAKSTAKPAVQ